LNDVSNTKQNKSKNEKDRSEDEEEEEDEFEDRNPNNFQPIASNQLKELPKFDFGEFFNLQNLNEEEKDLLDLMTRYY
jgi:hypothetical protein